VNAAVSHEALERHFGDLAAVGVEARDQHGFRRVIDDQVDPGHHLEGTDVATLAPDYATLHVVGWEGHDGHRVLRDVVACAALNGQGDHSLSLAPGGVLCLADDLLGDSRALFASLPCHDANQLGLGVIAVVGGHPFELCDRLVPVHGGFVAEKIDVALHTQEPLLVALELALALVEFAYPTLERLFTLVHAALAGK